MREMMPLTRSAVTMVSGRFPVFSPATAQPSSTATVLSALDDAAPDAQQLKQHQIEPEISQALPARVSKDNNIDIIEPCTPPNTPTLSHASM